MLRLRLRRLSYEKFTHKFPLRLPLIYFLSLAFNNSWLIAWMFNERARSLPFIARMFFLFSPLSLITYLLVFMSDKSRTFPINRGPRANEMICVWWIKHFCGFSSHPQTPEGCFAELKGLFDFLPAGKHKAI